MVMPFFGNGRWKFFKKKSSENFVVRSSYLIRTKLIKPISLHVGVVVIGHKPNTDVEKS